MIPVFAPWLSENARRYVLDCVDSGSISSLGQYVGSLRAGVRRLLRGAARSRDVQRNDGAPSGARHARHRSGRRGPRAGPHLRGDGQRGPPRRVRRPSWSTRSRAPGAWTHGTRAGRSRRAPGRSSRSTSTGTPWTWTRVLTLAAERRPRRRRGRRRGPRRPLQGPPGRRPRTDRRLLLLREQDHHDGRGRDARDRRAALAERAAFLRDHAMDPARRYYHPEVGFNYRMTNIQAAIGCAQLEQVDAILARRKAIAAAYDAGLTGVEGLTRPPSSHGPRTSTGCTRS